MATNTTNYGWTKPSYEDAADIEVINDTIDNIDAQVKANENNISKLDQKTISPTTVDNKKVFTIPIDTQAALIPISVGGDSAISDSALLAYNGLYDTKSVKIIANITSASVSAVESAV